jgi:hypothetical protein
MYSLKCPTLFRPPPIGSFVPASKWMPRSSYSPQKRLPQVRQTFVHSFNFYLPPPFPLSSTSHPLWFYFLPSSCTCHSENPRMEGQRVILGVRLDTHTYKHFQMFGYIGRQFFATTYQGVNFKLSINMLRCDSKYCVCRMFVDCL